MKLVPVLALSTLFWLTGCATSSNSNDGFVGSINFSSLDTFSYKNTLVTGFGWNGSESMMLERSSEAAVIEELDARGFSFVESGSDFCVVVKWTKSMSGYPGLLETVDGSTESMYSRDNSIYRDVPWLQLTLEVYETGTRQVFWRKALPNVLDAVALTEARVEKSIQQALKNFPNRVQ